MTNKELQNRINELEVELDKTARLQNQYLEALEAIECELKKVFEIN